MKKRLGQFIFLMLIFSLRVVSAETKLQNDLKAWRKTSEPLSQRLPSLYETYWKYLMTEMPEWASYTGFPGQNHRLADMSLNAIGQRQRDIHELFLLVKDLPEAELRGQELITLQLFKSHLQIEDEANRFPDHLIPITQQSGIQQDLVDLLASAPTLNLQDYRDRVERLKAVPVAVAQVQTLMEEGLRMGLTPAKIALASVPKQILDMTEPNIEKNPLYSSFLKIEAKGDEKEKIEIQKQAQKIIKDEVAPAFKKLHRFFTKVYLPKCREEVGLSSLPNGKAWYEHKIRKHTTTSLSADEIHTIGLKEVERIRKEMNLVREQVGFKGDLKKFEKFLKEDPQFYFRNSKDLLAAYLQIAKKIDPALMQVFELLPRLTYGVREMAAVKAPSAPAAYYIGGSLPAGRPGYFEVNTYDLKARPKWQMEALTLHEAVPGHHLQIALAQEIPDVPDFRRFMGTTSFVEGWGLYAESLGEDLGLYKDLYSKYGRLVFEMWRALRLVVDTGLHAKGWSRNQVMQYFRDHGPFSEQEIRSETDRYISWPGQALAYKLGELKIKEEKSKARELLGDNFNLRKFHAAVLDSGALPLDVLSKKLTSWMKEQKDASVLR